MLDPVGAHLEPGEILVAPSTDPGWTPLFLTAGGLVMEMGGSNSHGAVVAREYGIPAVVGVPDATRKIETGQLVTVDGAAGLVMVEAGGSGHRRPVTATSPPLVRSSPTNMWGTTGQVGGEVWLSLTERGENPLGDFVDRSETVDLDQQAAGAVEVEQRRGLLGVDLLTHPDRLFVVVGAATALGPLEQSSHDLVDVGHQGDHRVERLAGLGERGVEGLDLLEGARVAVEQEARLRRRAGSAARRRSHW